jgi:hypothetical protein
MDMSRWTTAEWDERFEVYQNDEGFEASVEPGDFSAPEDAKVFWVVRGSYPRFEYPEVQDCGFVTSIEEAKDKVEKYIEANPWVNKPARA